MTQDEAVQRLKEAGVDSARADARLLMEHAKVIEKSAMVARGKLDMIYDGLVGRRAAREPLAYITGRKEFWSLDFAVGPSCLIPRPDTETLIEEARKLVADRAAPLTILDLGTGSGCILLAALTEFPNAHGVGIDSSADALGWARRNIGLHKLEARASLIETGWLEEARPGFDLVFSNPPYIPTADIARLAPEVAKYEPHAALDGGPDGLDAYRALSARIGSLLTPTGHALLEIGIGQDAAVRDILLREHLQVVRVVADLAGISRVVVAKRNNQDA